MSYSFSITAATKDEAGQKVEEQLSQVADAQPVHALDRQAAQDAAEALVGLLADPAEGQYISMSIAGSLGWSGDEPAAGKFTSAHVSVSAHVATKA